jgi:hypothetical protein
VDAEFARREGINRKGFSLASFAAVVPSLVATLGVAVGALLPRKRQVFGATSPRSCAHPLRFAMGSAPGRSATTPESWRDRSRSIFAAAGFGEVGRPSIQRVVMRIDF